MRGLGRRSAGYKSLPGFTVYGGASPKIAAPGPEGAALARPGVSASAVATAAALCGGLLDISANLAFMYATRSGLLMIVSIVTSLYPAPTVLLAGIFLGEKLPPRRVAGLILALTGIVLVGIGA
jgi:drug/metabolite transporter (DMT)-like permease